MAEVHDPVQVVDASAHVALVGRGTSIWDTFCRRAGKVELGESGAVACDFYNLYRQDVALGNLGGSSHAFRTSVQRCGPVGSAATVETLNRRRGSP
jgi:beta-glucosidase/6-phospho-beta-glucosidase/beta-galactosidase